MIDFTSDDPYLGKGPLTLGIYCTKCKAQYELGLEGVAMAFVTSASFLDYLKFVQSSECRACERNGKHDETTQHN